MNEKLFHIHPWTPKIQDAAQDLIDEIRLAHPEIEVLFMGAAALGLPGKNDIDLDILCKQSDVATYTQKLPPILGTPKEIRDNLTMWEFKFRGFDVDAILSDPTISHVPEQQRVFERLKANPDLLAEYKNLKERCDGIPYIEYERQKKIFFTELVL